MSSDFRRNRLTVIIGGAEGPISRLDLWKRFQPVPKFWFMTLMLAKLLLLASMMYYFFT